MAGYSRVKPPQSPHDNNDDLSSLYSRPSIQNSPDWPSIELHSPALSVRTLNQSDGGTYRDNISSLANLSSKDTDSSDRGSVFTANMSASPSSSRPSTPSTPSASSRGKYQTLSLEKSGESGRRRSGSSRQYQPGLPPLVLSSRKSTIGSTVFQDDSSYRSVSLLIDNVSEDLPRQSVLTNKVLVPPLRSTTPGSSAVPVRHGPVPAGIVPSPYMIHLSPGHARSQVGAGRTSTLVSHAPPASWVPPLGSTPSGSAPVPEVLRRIKSHPKKMVTTVGQHRSVAMPALPVTKPTAPPRELPKSTPVQQPTTCLAPQSSLPLEGVSTRMTSIPSLPEAQDKLKIRTAPTPAPAVPTAPLASPPATPLAAAPPTHVDDMTCVPAPTLRERASCISITNDPTTGRSRLPTIVAELETSRRAVQASVLSPTNPEQSAIDTPPSRSSSSTPIVRQDRASVVLPGTSTQKRTDPKSIPASRNFIGTTTAIAPAPTLRATNATAPVGNITVLPTPVAPNGSPTAPPSKA
jgi:hypothetical protein